jgi:hypothetical protein
VKDIGFGMWVDGIAKGSSFIKCQIKSLFFC